MQITSPHNPRVKAAARLRDRGGREEQQRIIIDGLREIGRALDAGLELVEVYYIAERCTSDAHHRLLKSAQSRRIDLHEVTEPILERLAFGNRHEGLVAVANTPRRQLSELRLAEDALVAIVEGAEKPGNLGAILRTADAAGVSAVIVADGGTDLYNPNAIRASLGAIFTTPVCEAKSQDALVWLRQSQFRIFAARVDAACDYTAADFRGRTAIALGSEARGLSPHWQVADIMAIRLPMHGTVDSLNLSATAAILFYEAIRQRKQRQDSAADKHG